jgi:hypothetical protein
MVETGIRHRLLRRDGNKHDETVKELPRSPMKWRVVVDSLRVGEI